jgi:hypothetical protein
MLRSFYFCRAVDYTLLLLPDGKHYIISYPMRNFVMLVAALAPLGYQAHATTISTATAVFGGSTTCNQSDPALASCSQTLGFDTVGSSGTSNISTASGLLDVIVNASHSAGGFNNSPSGTASALFNEVLIVTGGTGSGTLVANFSGFDSVAGNGTLPPSPTLSLQLGSTNTTYTPGLVNAPFSFSTSFTFGTLIAFDASISASAAAPFLMANAASNSDVEGKVNFTGFTILGVNGQPIPGTVVFTPEPSLSILVGMILLAASGFRSSQNRRDASKD